MAQKRITDLEVGSALIGDELFEISQVSDEVFVQATTLSASAADNSFNDSANGFVTAGFEVGNRVRVTGFTGNAANNLFVGIVTAVAPGKLTIGGTDGDVIVDDAAGELVTIAKWTSRRIDIDTIVALVKTVGSTVQLEGGDYNVDPADVGNFIRLTGAGAKNIGIALNATTALPANGEWHFRNVGAGDATFVPTAGVTVNVPNGGTLVFPQGGTVTLKRVAVDTFDLLGQTVGA